MLMVAQQKEPHYTVEEYFALEDDNPDVKHEYIDGHVYMMSGGSTDHWRIAFNVATALDRRLNLASCRVYGSDVRVKISHTRYVYPDVTVTCDPTEHGKVLVIKAPRVIFEVLSPGTEKIDRMRKMRYYRACPSIQEYVLIDPNRMYVEVYRRAQEFWQLFSFEASDNIVLTSIDVTIPIEEFYHLIELEPEDEGADPPSLP
jgi:Uma2 family endonuclease